MGPTDGRTGRRPGGADTKHTIAQSARRNFAERGYAASSIRAIAADAGVDPSLVHHYFGTKERLFRESMEVPLDPATIIAHITADGPDAVPRRLVRAFLHVWDDTESGPAAAGFLRRVLAEPETAGLLREFIGAEVITTVAAGLLDDAETTDARRRVSLVMSQLVGLVIARRLIGVEPLASWPADDLAGAVAPTVERYLRGAPLVPDVTFHTEPPHDIEPPHHTEPPHDIEPRSES